MLTSTQKPLFSICGAGRATFFALFLPLSLIGQTQLDFTVDCAEEKGDLKIFWNCIGADPKNWRERDDRDAINERLLSPQWWKNLMYLGSIPHNGQKYLRLHYLLHTVECSDPLATAPQYDFTRLDSALQVHYDSKMTPFMELMGRPGGFDWDFAQDEHVHAWRKMIAALMTHLQDKYGQDEVRTWYFETWNELGTGFWEWNTSDFPRYYDACIAGMEDVDSHLRLAAPASKYSTATLFAHCNNGTNFFTGDTGNRLDFVSVHVKGGVTSMVDQEINLINGIRSNYPNIQNAPFMNTECDPAVGWSTKMDWRPKPVYAAWTCNAVYQHLYRIVDSMGVDYEMLSWDNAFPASWERRTQLAQFGDSMVVSFVKKPIHNCMVMLSLLGNNYLAVEEELPMNGSGIIPTKRDDNQVAIILFNEGLSGDVDSLDKQVNLTIKNIPFASGKLVHYRIDHEHTNPWRIWETYPNGSFDAAKLQELWDNQELEYMEPPSDETFANNEYSATIDLPLDATSLILLCKDPGIVPPVVQNVRVLQTDGHKGNEFLITWDPLPSRFIQTYEVLYSETKDGLYERINQSDFLTGIYAHMGPSQMGCYKVQAKDFWGRVSDSTVNASREIRFHQNSAEYNRVQKSLSLISGDKKFHWPKGVTGFALYDLKGRKLAEYTRPQSNTNAVISLQKEAVSEGMHVIKFTYKNAGN
ncbi:MAG: hypothetical protein GF401_06200 [Chitinivibrionales bacterium]|nr:hypothetical protein [Chitinivibrionales bacterium]